MTYKEKEFWACNKKKFCCRKSKRHLSSCQIKNLKKKKVPRKQQTTLPFIPSGATEINSSIGERRVGIRETAT
jgi:hypothetical protein